MKLSSVFLLLLLCTRPAIADIPNIKVVAEHLPPYQIDIDGHVSGLAVDIVHKLIAMNQVEASIDILPWARAYRIAQDEPNILILSISRSVEREQKFAWVGEIAASDSYFWKLKSRDDVTVTHNDELSEFTIGLQRNDHQHEFVDSMLGGNQGNVVITTSKAQVIEMLFRERVDLIIGNRNSLHYRSEGLGLDSAMLEPLLPIENMSASLNIAFSLHTDKQLIEGFRKAFKSLERSGELNALKAKWKVN